MRNGEKDFYFLANELNPDLTPEEDEMCIRDSKNGVTLVNSPGTIDSDYRGEIQVILINQGQEPFIVQRGMRLAQMVIAPVLQIAWQQVTALDQTQRGAGGFGHTGL